MNSLLLIIFLADNQVDHRVLWWGLCSGYQRLTRSQKLKRKKGKKKKVLTEGTEGGNARFLLKKYYTTSNKE